MNPALVIATILLLSACSVLEIEQVTEDDNSVNLYTEYQSVKNCLFIDEVIGSQGTWYDYWFISNKNLTRGAVNDLKNEAKRTKANAVLVHSDMRFNTSVTLLGQAYNCSKNNIQNNTNN